MFILHTHTLWLLNWGDSYLNTLSKQSILNCTYFLCYQCAFRYSVSESITLNSWVYVCKFGNCPIVLSRINASVKVTLIINNLCWILCISDFRILISIGVLVFELSLTLTVCFYDNNNNKVFGASVSSMTKCEMSC